LVADKVYDSKRFRESLRSKGIKPTIPSYQPAGKETSEARTPGEGRSGLRRALEGTAWGKIIDPKKIVEE
jgi:hypothetical protein